MIIAAVGMPGSGKSVFAEEMRQRAMPVVYFGGLVLQEVKDRGLPGAPDNERMVREDLRQKFGMDAMAQLALPTLKAKQQTHGVVGIDGLYSFSEYKTLKSAFGAQLQLVAIMTPAALRYQRLGSRPVRPLTPDEARARDIAEIENLEKGGPIAIADHFIINDGGLEAFLEKARHILDGFGKAIADQ